MENQVLIERLLQCKIRRFRPSIPHLVYQYGLYSNYESETLNQVNPEVPERNDDDDDDDDGDDDHNSRT